MTTIAQERAARAAVGLVMRTREQWGARFDYTTARAVDEPATRLFWHITITNPDAYSSNDAHARAVENIGINRFPSTGISYNGLILPGGQLYEAQPFGRRGAHTVNDFQRSNCTTFGCPSRSWSLTAPSWNLNVNSRALALARNTDDPVTDVDVAAAARWGAGYKLAGLVTKDARWHGHRCVSSKSCPGDKAWARIGDVADLTATYLRTGLPGAEEDEVTPEDIEKIATAVWFRKTGEKNSDGSEQNFWQAIKDMPETTTDQVWWRSSGLKNADGGDIALWQVLRDVRGKLDAIEAAVANAPEEPTPDPLA